MQLVLHESEEPTNPIQIRSVFKCIKWIVENTQVKNHSISYTMSARDFYNLPKAYGDIQTHMSKVI